MRRHGPPWRKSGSWHRLSPVAPGDDATMNSRPGPRPSSTVPSSWTPHGSTSVLRSRATELVFARMVDMIRWPSESAVPATGVRPGATGVGDGVVDAAEDDGRDPTGADAPDTDAVGMATDVPGRLDGAARVGGRVAVSDVHAASTRARTRPPRAPRIRLVFPSSRPPVLDGRS